MLSRRDFTRGATIGAAITVSSPASGAGIIRSAAGLPGEPKQTPAEAAKLSPQSLVEAETRYQAILQQYGERFSEVQKVDIRRLCMVAQQALDAVRALSLGNADQPSLYLKPLVELDKETATGALSGKPSTANHPVPVKP